MNEVKFDEKDFKNEISETNKLLVYFPKYREKYIDQVSKYIIKALENKKLSCEINLKERSLEICTTKKTRDPFIFIKGCEFIRLISKNCDVETASKVLEDDFVGEIINIRKLVKSESVFERRRDRLIGKNSLVLKALKMISKCYIFITGKYVSVVGSYDGLTIVKQIVTDCLVNNKHPVYEIKKMIIKNNLEEDKNLENEDWSRHIPEYKKRSQKKKTKQNDTEKN
ncbi:ribosome biogenesis protein (KRR1) [Vairimorpha necatrix]|uniref:KRR-R motif-containing protein 1 n=1 Tax=Vairimorpha necatrix TaxID=6039 RepID=A0AAX4J8W2_9MICR